jgi:hypothetical protein
MESSTAKKKTAKKTIPTKTGVNSAGDRLKRLKENRDGSPARKPPKIRKDAIREGCEELKLLQEERVERKIPPTETGIVQMFI